MRKLLFLIPLIIVFVSACTDIDQTQSKKYTEDNSTNQPVNPGGNNGGQTNPDGDGNDNGTTTDPNPGGDGNGGTTVDPEPGGDGEGGTTTDPNPGGDGEGGTTTDPNPGGDGEGGTTTDPEPGGDGEGGTTTDPNPDGDGDGGTTTDPEPGGDGDGGTTTDPNPGGDGNGDPTDQEDPLNKPGYDTTFNAKTDVFQPQYYYGRSLLTEEEQKAYDLLMKTFVEFEVTEANKNNTRIGANFKNNGIRVTYNQLIKIVKYILYDEQRLTYLITSYVPRGTATGTPSTPAVYEGQYVVEAYYDVAGMLMSSAKAIYNYQSGLIETGAQEILKHLKGDMTEAQKFRVIHDEFIKSVSYGMLTLGVNDIRGGLGPDKKVLCEGYARTLAYLCQRAGIECIYVVGTATYSGTGSDGSSGFDHAWNKVKIDGEWYNVDPTNNDGMTPGSSYVYYNNFLQSDSEFFVDHIQGKMSNGAAVSYDKIPESALTSYSFSLTEYNK